MSNKLKTKSLDLDAFVAGITTKQSGQPENQNSGKPENQKTGKPENWNARNEENLNNENSTHTEREEKEKVGLPKVNDNGLKKITVRIKEGLHREIKIRAAEKGVTIETLIQDILNEGLLKGK